MQISKEQFYVTLTEVEKEQARNPVKPDAQKMLALLKAKGRAPQQTDGSS